MKAAAIIFFLIFFFSFLLRPEWALDSGCVCLSFWNFQIFERGFFSRTPSCRTLTCPPPLLGIRSPGQFCSRPAQLELGGGTERSNGRNEAKTWTDQMIYTAGCFSYNCFYFPTWSIYFSARPAIGLSDSPLRDLILQQRLPVLQRQTGQLQEVDPAPLCADAH